MSSASSEPPARHASGRSATVEEAIDAAPPMPAPDDGLSPLERHKALEALWSSGRGLQRLSSVNHTVLGRRFIIAAFVGWHTERGLRTLGLVER